MHEFIIFTIGGLATAGIYAITASGLTLTYATTGIFNWLMGRSEWWPHSPTGSCTSDGVGPPLLSSPSASWCWPLCSGSASRGRGYAQARGHLRGGQPW